MKYLAALLALIGSAALLMTAMGNADDAAARRLYAQSVVIQANSAARQDLLAGLMPYVVIAISLIVAAIVILALSFTFLSVFALWTSKPWEKNRPPQIERIIETRSILILQPGEHSKRELYKLLVGGK